MLMVNPLAAQKFSYQNFKCATAQSIFAVLSAVSQRIERQIYKKLFTGLAFQLMTEIRRYIAINHVSLNPICASRNDSIPGKCVVRAWSPAYTMIAVAQCIAVIFNINWKVSESTDCKIYTQSVSRPRRLSQW